MVDCRLARRDSYQDKRTSVRDYIKSVDQSSPYDDKSASISVRVHGQPILALLDTGAKVNVVDRQTVEYLGLGQFIKPEIGRVYGVCGTPVSVVGSIEIPIEVNGEKAEKTHVQVLDGEEQALLLGRQFLRRFGRVEFDWDKGTITLGKVKVTIQGNGCRRNPNRKSAHCEVNQYRRSRQIIQVHEDRSHYKPTRQVC